jgi:uncharacterized membrane protein YjjP (DUF1212 family)
MRRMSSELHAKTQLLLDLAQELHGVQMPADVVESRLERVSRGLGVNAQFLTAQRAVIAEVAAEPENLLALRAIPFSAHWNLARVGDLVRLCRGLSARELTVAAGRDRLRQLAAAPPPYPRLLTVFAYGLYSVAVAIRVGGGLPELAVGGVIGLVSGWIHFGAHRYRSIDLIKSFLAAFVGTFIALAATRVMGPFDLARALFAGITLLVPATALAIATEELAHEALGSGLGRLGYALLRFVMIGAGVAAAANIWQLFRPGRGTAPAIHFPEWIVFLALILAGAALTVTLQARARDAGWVIFAAVLAFFTQEGSKHVFGERGAPFLAAFVLGVAANLQARRSERVPGTMLVPGILQLSPGFLGVQAVLVLLGQGSGSANAFSVMLVATQLVAGLIVANALFRRSAAT